MFRVTPPDNKCMPLCQRTWKNAKNYKTGPKRESGRVRNFGQCGMACSTPVIVPLRWSGDRMTVTINLLNWRIRPWWKYAAMIFSPTKWKVFWGFSHDFPESPTFFPPCISYLPARSFLPSRKLKFSQTGKANSYNDSETIPGHPVSRSRAKKVDELGSAIKFFVSAFVDGLTYIYCSTLAFTRPKTGHRVFQKCSIKCSILSDNVGIQLEHLVTVVSNRVKAKHGSICEW